MSGSGTQPNTCSSTIGCTCPTTPEAGAINPLATTDTRGFTTRVDRNEMGEVYRTISPQPYNFLTENYFDANRNVVRSDTQDMQPKYDSADPTSAAYAQFSPSGSNYTAHVPMQPGPGGSVRPGWFTDLYTFDLLDNMIEEDKDATGSNPANLITKMQYDPNQNLIAVIKPEGNMVEHDYDERNFRIATRIGAYLGGPWSVAGGRLTGEVIVPDNASVTITVRDGNGNVIQVITPLTNGASEGNQQSVTIEDAFRSSSTVTYIGVFALQYELDGFDRVIKAMDAVGGYIDTGVGYTGSGPDECGPFLDPDGRVIMADTYGTTGGETPTDRYGGDNVRLASKIMRFDEGGRQYEAQRQVFYAGPALTSSRDVTHNGGGLETNSIANNHTAAEVITTGGESYVLTRNIFDAGGRTITVLADDPDGISPTVITYNGANRDINITDALGNMIDKTFDSAGNVIYTLRTELCTIEGVDTIETFASAAFYDSLNQSVLQANQGPDGAFNTNIMGLVGSSSFWASSPWNLSSSTLISCFGFDSRGNNVLTVDPKGNSSVTVVDGESRTIQTQQHMRIAGQGGNPPAQNQTLLPASDGTIVTTRILDGNGRQTQLIDDRGNITLFEFDTLDREVKMIFHDGSTRTNEYDLAGDVILYTDENGSTFTNTFDALGRKYDVDIAPNTAPGVQTTTAGQAFEFDGLSRTTFAVDTDGTNASTVLLAYDSISRTLEESQANDGDTRNVTNTVFTSYPVSQFTFPNDRAIDFLYDLLYRRTNINEDDGGANIAAWNFFGPSRTAQILLGNGLAATWMNNAGTNSAVQVGVPNPPWGTATSDRLGYDGSGRAIAKRYLPYVAVDTVIAPDSEAWTPPETGTYFVECYGSGGKGGDSVDSEGFGNQPGGGGGGGGYSFAHLDLIGGESYAYTVDPANNEGETTFTVGSTTVTATSGANGEDGVDGVAGAGGAGGTGNENGTAGADAIHGGDGGNGGSAAGPAGGVGGAGAVDTPAVAGSPYGGGGGGDDAEAVAGGASGADGAIVVNAVFYTSTTPVVGFTTAFDQASNKFYERALHAENRSSLYEPFDLVNNLPTGGYDSVDRLRRYQRGTLASTGGDGGNGGGSIALPIALTGTDTVRTYNLDGLGNWKNTAFTPSTTGTPMPQTEVRQHNGLNQITRLSNPTASELVDPTYDKNGNLLTDGTRSYTWDALNRLIAPTVGDTTFGPYVYDAFNRRIRKTVGDTITDFIYSGWRCMEDRNPGADGGDAPIIQYIWGRYLDELIQMTTYVSIFTGDQPIEYVAGTYYPLQDLLYRTTATTDASGNIVEAYDFDAYGNTLIFNAAGDSGINWWSPYSQQSPNSLCQFLFTGQRIDAETGLYYYKMRPFDPVLGRFLSCDRIASIGRCYFYCGGNPAGYVDPSGLQQALLNDRIVNTNTFISNIAWRTFWVYDQSGVVSYGWNTENQCLAWFNYNLWVIFQRTWTTLYEHKYANPNAIAALNATIQQMQGQLGQLQSQQQADHNLSQQYAASSIIAAGVGAEGSGFALISSPPLNLAFGAIAAVSGISSAAFSAQSLSYQNAADALNAPIAALNTQIMLMTFMAQTGLGVADATYYTKSSNTEPWSGYTATGNSKLFPIVVDGSYCVCSSTAELILESLRHHRRCLARQATRQVHRNSHLLSRGPTIGYTIDLLARSVSLSFEGTFDDGEFVLKTTYKILLFTICSNLSCYQSSGERNRDHSTLSPGPMQAKPQDSPTIVTEVDKAAELAVKNSLDGRWNSSLWIDGHFVGNGTAAIQQGHIELRTVDPSNTNLYDFRVGKGEALNTIDVAGATGKKDVNSHSDNYWQGALKGVFQIYGNEITIQFPMNSSVSRPTSISDKPPRGFFYLSYTDYRR